MAKMRAEIAQEQGVAYEAVSRVVRFLVGKALLIVFVHWLKSLS